VRHIAAGDLPRAEAQTRGDLVPDQIVLDVLTLAVVEAAARGGYILDGFPRMDLGDSPWILLYPQPWFSMASRSMSAAISALTGGRPVRCG